MCGIAGFCLAPDEKVNARLLASSLLLGIEVRGRDATGAAWRDHNNGRVMVQKRDIPASLFNRSLSIDRKATTAVLHTRFATQGDPVNNMNNHPIVSGNIVGVHNGMVSNDDSLFARMNATKLRQAQVDSEAIFATIAYGLEEISYEYMSKGQVVEDVRRRIRTADTLTDLLEEIRGSAAIAWLNMDDDPNVLHMARLQSSPLVWAQTPAGSVVFGSTEGTVRHALDSVGLTVAFMEDAAEGSYYKVEGGVVTEAKQFQAHSYYSDYSSSGTSLTGWKSTGSTYVSKGGSSYDRLPAATNKANGTRVSTGKTETPTTAMWSPQARATWRVEGGSSADAGNDEMKWLNAEFLDFYTEVEETSEAVYRREYELRGKNVGEYMEAVPGTQSEWYDTYYELLGDARPGMWVEAKLGDDYVVGQILTMPQTFPDGNYILRLFVPTMGFRNESHETVLVSRQYYEFSLVDTNTKTVREALSDADQEVSPKAEDDEALDDLGGGSTPDEEEPTDIYGLRQLIDDLEEEGVIA